MAKKTPRARRSGSGPTPPRAERNFTTFGVRLGSIFDTPADVAAFKYSEGASGLSAEIADRLRRALKVEVPIEPERGKHVLLDPRGLVAARRVLILGTAPVWDFDYAEVKTWSQGVLEALTKAAPDTRTLVVPLHGANRGLDEPECVRQLVLGCVDAIHEGRCPRALRDITLVERDRARYELIVRSLAQIFRTVLKQPVGWTPQPDRWCISTAPAPRAREPYEEPPRKQTAFVAMSFQRTRDVWRFGIQRPLQDIVLCERMDEQAFTGDILGEIKKRIERADIVIADITGANPNVFLEIGYAWAKERRTVLICRKPDAGAVPPFDVRGQRYIEYDDITDLEEKLTKEVQSILGGAPKPLEGSGANQG